MKKIVQEYYTRNKQITENGFYNYQEFLKSDLWQKTREKFHKFSKGKHPEIWSKCHCCGTTEKKLIPHHLIYSSPNFKMIHLSHIVPVCDDCHQFIHDYHNKHRNITIAKATQKARKIIIKNKVR